MAGFSQKPDPLPVDDGKKSVSTSKYEEDERHQVDLSPLKTFGGLKFCYSKEWYRFPGHYLIGEGVQAEFVKSELDGMLPAHVLQAKKVQLVYGLGLATGRERVTQH
ncbi:mannosyltransferase [Tulasnella sp. UAMH 9824]|nr:mannosyltransferase [Tulasnella sp. UAMH 9824]